MNFNPVSYIKHYLESRRLTKALNYGVTVALSKLENAGYTTDYHGKKIGNKGFSCGPYSGLCGFRIIAKKNGYSIAIRVEDHTFETISYAQMLADKETHQAVICFTSARLKHDGMEEEAIKEIKMYEDDNAFLVEGADIEELNQLLDRVLF